MPAFGIRPHQLFRITLTLILEMNAHGPGIRLALMQILVMVVLLLMRTACGISVPFSAGKVLHRS